MTLKPESKTHDATVVVLGDKMLRWAYFDSETNTCTSIGKYEYGVNENVISALLAWIDQEQIRHQKKLQVGLAGVPFTLIPSSLYDEEHEQQYASLNHTSEGGYSLFKQQLSHLDAVAVATTHSELLPIITDKLPQAQISLQSANMIEALLLDQGTQTRNKTYVYLGSDYIECFVFSGRNLLLHNQNKVSHASDVLYFVQLTIGQVDFNQVDRIIMWGELEKRMLSELIKYYKVEEFYGLKYQKLGEGVVQSDKVNYSDLFSLYQCG